MNIISRLFARKKKNEQENKPPIYGGDGLSDYSPAILNCSSMGMAHALIDSFISEKCGNEWEQKTAFTIAAPNTSNKTVKMVCIQAFDGSEHKFYFDLSRPVDASMKMIGIR